MSSFHFFLQQWAAEKTRYNSVKGNILLKFSTFTYKHEFKPSQPVPACYIPPSMFSAGVFSASVRVGSHCGRQSLSHNQQILTPFSSNPEFSEAYPMYRFTVMWINYTKQCFKRAPFMPPRPSFATLYVHIK